MQPTFLLIYMIVPLVKLELPPPLSLILWSRLREEKWFGDYGIGWKAYNVKPLQNLLNE